jgi:hypothetical protein
VITTLLITILVEGAIVFVYATWQGKPVRSLLFTSVAGNLLTQFMLWMILTIFYRHYLASFIIAEILVWAIESLLFYAIPSNQLKLVEAILLSLGINLTSLGLGLFLPV